MKQWRRRLRRTWRRTPVARRLRHTRRALRRYRKQLRIGLAGAGLLIVLGLIWIAITALLARRQASALDDRLQQVRVLLAEGQLADAQTVAKSIPALADRAHDLTSGPAWWIGAHLPFVGAPLEVARGTTAAGAKLGGAVPGLMRVVQQLNPETLRASGSTIKLAPLVHAVPALDAAANTIDGAARSMAALPQSTWLSVVDHGRSRYASDISIIRGYVDAAARVARVLPIMLGQDGPKTYFIGLQNEAELRGTGGLPGAFAIARAENGTIHFLRFESDAALEPPGESHLVPTGLSFGAGYDALYGPSMPTETFVDSNVSPNFPYAAQIWRAMWKKVSGQEVDGVLALDPTVLSYFLAVTGPTQLPSGQVIDAQNVVSLTQRDEYTMFADNTARKNFIVGVLKAASTKLTSGAGSGQQILRAASQAGAAQRLLAWSSDPTVEAALEASHFAGAIPRNDRPFSGLILNNAASGKLDYYLTRSLAYERTGCGSTRDVIVTIKLTNSAPASGLPPYVVSRLDDPPPGAKPGDNHELVDYYATAGAQLTSVTLNGEPSTAAVASDLGHPVFRMSLELPRGTTQTVALHLSEPAGKGAPQIWQQPGVTPLDVAVYDQNC